MNKTQIIELTNGQLKLDQFVCWVDHVGREEYPDQLVGHRSASDVLQPPLDVRVVDHQLRRLGDRACRLGQDFNQDTPSVSHTFDLRLSYTMK